MDNSTQHCNIIAEARSTGYNLSFHRIEYVHDDDDDDDDDDDNHLPMVILALWVTSTLPLDHGGDLDTT
jgi:hypothetical protein